MGLRVDPIVWRLMAQHRRDRLCPAIEETGLGIPQQDLPHLFENFYRVSA